MTWQGSCIFGRRSHSLRRRSTPLNAKRNCADDPAVGSDGPQRRGPGPAAGRSKSIEILSFAPVPGRARTRRYGGDSDVLGGQHDYGPVRPVAARAAWPSWRRTFRVHPGQELPWRTARSGSALTTRANATKSAGSRPRCVQPPPLPRRPPDDLVVQRRSDGSTGELTIDRVCLITSLSVFDANWIREHKGIEKLLHQVRDRTFRKDDSKFCTLSLPRSMASLRNLAISLLGARTVRATSPLASATPPASSAGPYEPWVSPGESRPILITHCPRRYRGIVTCRTRRCAAESHRWQAHVLTRRHLRTRVPTSSVRQGTATGARPSASHVEASPSMPGRFRAYDRFPVPREGVGHVAVGRPPACVRPRCLDGPASRGGRRRHNVPRKVGTS